MVLDQISVCDNRKIYTSIIQDIAIQSDSIFSESDGLILGTPPGYSFSWDLYPEDILCEKTPAIRHCKNCNHNLKFMTLGGMF